MDLPTKRIILCLLASSMPAMMTYPHVLDPAARCAAVKTTTLHRNATQARTPAAQSEYVPIILDISSEKAVDELEAIGCVIFNRRDNLLLACVPADKLADLANIPTLTRASLARKATTTMDIARTITGINDIHSGSATGIIADGTGVVVGICDIGFDPSFIEFGDRVKLVSDYDAQNGSCRSAEGDDVKSWDTDDTDQYHGTHVCGILAGEPGFSPYYGAAPGAEIVATTSRLTEVGILAGAEDIIDYAKRKGRPAVINMSLGDYIGPHDGSDLFCQYIDRCADDALIVLAAGNEGNSNISLRHVFSDNAPTVSTAIENMEWDGMHITGVSDLWSIDDRAFEVQLKVLDKETEQYVYSSPWLGGSSDTDYWHVSSDDDEAFAKLYTGIIQAAWEVSPYNNRYNIQVNYDAECAQYGPGSSTSRYYLCLSARASTGVTVDLYADGQYTWFRGPGLAGLVSGNANCSISNMSCTHKTLTVGNYVSRNTAPSIIGDEKSWAVTVGEPTPSTSYGTLIDGRTLPHLCAPGTYIVAPLSTYYADSHPSSAQTSCHTAEYNDRSYYWKAMAGTSMAAPHMAGIAACWLSLNPDLSPAQLREIAITTADNSKIDTADPRWGAGLVNAEAGARKIIEGSVSLPGIDNTQDTISYFDIHGRPVSAQDLLPGIYIAIIGGKAKKIAVR